MKNKTKPIRTVTDLFLDGFKMNLSADAIDPNKYLKNVKTPSTVYQDLPSSLFFNPFNFNHDDFGRLIIISFEDHADIRTIELIVQDEDKGAYVVIYYYDGKVENYLSSNFASDPKFVKLDRNWDIIENHDFQYFFEDTPKGLFFSLDIKIRNEQHFKISIRENKRAVKRFSFMATIGAELSEVERFPLIYMKDAAMVPVEGTGLSFEWNGKMMELSKIPISVEGEMCYRIVYAFKRLPFFWNETQDVFLSSEKLNNTLTFRKNHVRYSLFDNDGHREIESIDYKANGHTAHIRFAPAFPDIDALKIGGQVKGRFCIGVDEVEGVIGGKYAVKNREGNISIDLRPEKCWGSTGLKNWVNAYRYRADWEPVGDNKYEVCSEWTVT